MALAPHALFCGGLAIGKVEDAIALHGEKPDVRRISRRVNVLAHGLPGYPRES